VRRGPASQDAVLGRHGRLACAAACGQAGVSSARTGLSPYELWAWWGPRSGPAQVAAPLDIQLRTVGPQFVEKQLPEAAQCSSSEAVAADSTATRSLALERGSVVCAFDAPAGHFSGRVLGDTSHSAAAQALRSKGITPAGGPGARRPVSRPARALPRRCRDYAGPVRRRPGLGPTRMSPRRSASRCRRADRDRRPVGSARGRAHRIAC
jgi:hypothetical protein